MPSNRDSDYFNFKKEQLYSSGFKTVVVLLILLAFIPVIMGFLGIKGYYLETAPCWFMNIYLWLGIATVCSAIGIYFLKKIAVFLYLAFVLTLYFLFLFAYNVQLHDSIFTLFFFIGLGLYAIIPRWKFFTWF